MDEVRRNRFISLWRKYFGDAELPIAVFYSEEPAAQSVADKDASRCVVGSLPLVMAGQHLSISADSSVCDGAKRYFGFTPEIPMQDFEYFLSYGIPGKVKGERYKKSPEIVQESTKFSPPLKAPKPYIVFKRWDKLSGPDNPEVVLFLANQDVISGLFTLANFDEAEPNAVICPFGSGCSSIVYYPYLELQSQRPRCVLGMFDISARVYVGENTLSFAIPITKFDRMVSNMSKSFLTTTSWKKMYRRDSGGRYSTSV